MAVALALPLGLQGGGALAAVTFIVNANGDALDANIGDGVCQTSTAGECTLRAALQEANATGGFDTINFALPSGPTIQPATSLPDVTDGVFIDGTTQSGGYVELNGTSTTTGINGLTIRAGGSTVRGLVINRFGARGILLITNGGNTIKGNRIGTNLAGTAALPNGDSGIEVSSGQNVIGGTSVGDRNVISGNGASGLVVFQATGNQVLGNYIGTDASGTAALANASYGVGVSNSPQTTIGGTALGARNIISGNGEVGIRVVSASSTGTVIQGNLIGTDVTGTAALGNGKWGVTVELADATIGGTAPGAGNVISGNGWEGIRVEGAATSGNVIQGNLIGTDVTGTAALGNALSGLFISNTSNVTVGGTTAGAGNVVSGNGLGGVVVVGASSTGNVIQGNRIGTDATGTAALGNAAGGVAISGSSNTIGGTTPGAGNLISANARGVEVSGGTGNRISGNSIHGNQTLGIDLGSIGVLANDAGDPDTGPNLLQNYPVLTAAAFSAAGTSLTGTLNSTPSTSFAVELFSSPACDASGFGEGRTYLTSISVTTDAAGDAAFTQTLASLTVGTALTATATDPAGNTSEFSKCAIVRRPSLPGVVAGSTAWSLRDSLTTGPPTTAFSFGTRPLVPLMGDWDGNGSRTPAYYKGGTFYLRNTNSAGPENASFAFGDARGFPVAGDFNGDGTDDVAVFRSGTWEVRLSTGATSSFSFGSGTWPSVVPVAGDWNGDGTDGVGYYCRTGAVCPAGTWNLRQTATSAPAGLTFVYNPGTSPYPVVGDWDADGVDTVGVRSGLTPSTWQLNNQNDGSAAEVTFDFGAGDDLPVIWA